MKSTNAKSTNAKFQYATVIDGKKVVLAHTVRRQYAVMVDGKKKGYITARDASNAINRVNSTSIKELKLH